MMNNEQKEVVEFIAQDLAGWKQQTPRLTHLPSYNTLVCAQHWNATGWAKAQIQWLQQYDKALIIYNCPEKYTCNIPLVTAAERIAHLEAFIGLTTILGDTLKTPS